MIDAVSQNSFGFLSLLLIVLFVLAITVFVKEIKLLFSNGQLLGVLLGLSLTATVSKFFSTSVPEASEFYIYLSIILVCVFGATIFGLLTELILQAVRGEKTSIVESLLSMRKWFVRSLLAYCLGLGNFLIFYLFPNWERPQRIFLCIIWTALTFALFPLLIADEGNPFLAVGRAFKITILSFQHWFYLFLITLFVSGEFLQLFPSSSVRVSWTGGYTFQPIWFDLMIKSADLSPTAINLIYVVVLFICSVIATLVKIKLTKILFNLGYISNTLNDSSVK